MTWKKYKFNEIISKANTGLDAIKRAPIVNYNTGIKCLRIQDVSQGKDYCNWGFTEVSEENYLKFSLQKDEIIVARTGNTVGVNFFVDKPYKSVFNNGLIRLRVDKNKFNAKYVYFYMQTAYYWAHINSIAFGTSTQPNMQIASFLEFQILAPDLHTQNRIASILSSFDDKIKLNRRMNQTLEQMAQALFNHYFVDNIDPDNLPDGWKNKRVKDIAKVNVKTLSKNDNHLKIDYVEISTVNKGEIANVTSYIRGKEPSRARRILTHGDTVLSTVRPDRGSYFLAVNPHKELIVSTGFAVFTSTKVPYTFLYLLLTQPEMVKYYGSVANGAAYPAINPETISQIDFILPINEVLEEFHKKVEQLLLKFHTNNREAKVLAQIRNILLPKLMSGEIDVSNLNEEKIIEKYETKIF